ncbi:MAG TPA: type II toxin-antitoxin system VapC family toxin [Longimicrobiales bacterium]|nr:type II toxin-antitoxin system VapC family toxin [Longimicrobiales bacterium]
MDQEPIQGRPPGQPFAVGDSQPTPVATFDVEARVRGLSAYDASYLDLAMRYGIPLATLDQRLRAAAEAEGVERYGG